MSFLQSFHIDLNTITKCNLNCKYCYESKQIKQIDNKINYDILDKIISKLNELSNSNFIKQNYSNININFWGGEPTLSYDVIKYYLNNLKGNYTFFIYTNGYNFSNEIKKLLLEYVNKIIIQISYDFYPIHDKFRVDKDNKQTSKNILENIDWVYKNKFRFTIKSTIPHKSLKDMFKAYKDCVELTKKYNINYKYSPTIVQFISKNDLKRNINNYISDLNNSLENILKEELKYFKTENKTYFGMFDNNRALCSAGHSLLSIDIDGKVYKCHGTLYSKSKDLHYVTDVEKISFVEDIQKSHENHNDFQIERCKDCFATYCHRCNAEHFDLSNKEDYFDKWYDFSNDENYCLLYKQISKFSIAFRRLIGEKYDYTKTNR